MTDLGEGPGPPGPRIIFRSDYGGKKAIGNLNKAKEKTTALHVHHALFVHFFALQCTTTT